MSRFSQAITPASLLRTGAALALLALAAATWTVLTTTFGTHDANPVRPPV